MIDNSTIAAISTPPGTGAIAVIRMSGINAISICNNIFHSSSHKDLTKQSGYTMHHGSLIDNGKTIDDVIVGLFRAPNSYTGEDVVEISCHGSVYVQQKILELLSGNGARPAQPGEFTMRAFLNGKLDLSQAEGVADLIASSGSAAHRVAINQIRGGISNEIRGLRDQLLNFISMIELELDFSEEDVEFADRGELKVLVSEIEQLLRKLIDSFSLGNAIKNGIPVAIAGKTNSGKSTLLNLLLKEDKAIVSDIGGTTRDFIEDIISVNGIHFRFIDTAGIRHTSDEIEKLGIERTYQKINQAEVILLLTDVTDTTGNITGSIKGIKEKISDTDKKLVVIANKSDLINNTQTRIIKDSISRCLDENDRLLFLSAKYGNNLDKLENILGELIHAEKLEENDVLITNARHYEALSRAHESILRVTGGLENQVPADLLAMDIREVLHYLGEITGEITTDEILGNIFKNFCIGK